MTQSKRTVSLDKLEQPEPSNPSVAPRQQLVSFQRSWVWVVLLLLLVWNVLPFIAPVLMWAEVEWLGRVIYVLYGGFCHQMPQRSFFLFGPSVMIDLDVVQSHGVVATYPHVLRQFIGNEVVGWKVAWSDRMVYMYGATTFFWAVYAVARNRWRPFPLYLFFMLLMPMLFDGITHTWSDFAYGIGGGFRDHNQWLLDLTRSHFNPAFYAGDGVGSFNSWMRLLSGVTFGLAVVGTVAPRLEMGTLSTSK